MSTNCISCGFGERMIGKLECEKCAALSCKVDPLVEWHEQLQNVEHEEGCEGFVLQPEDHRDLFEKGLTPQQAFDELWTLATI